MTQVSGGFWEYSVADVINSLILVATIVAIIIGPTRAVEMQRRRDDQRDEQQRRRSIAAALMRTRRMYMHVDHVNALNLIQLEFHGSKAVIETLRAYISNLNAPMPAPGNDLDNFLQTRRDLFIDILYEICVVIGLAIEKHDLERLAYLPLGWTTDDSEQRRMRNAIVEVMEGRRPLVTAQFSGPPPGGPFPAAP